jgi:hypothetical protein
VAKTKSTPLAAGAAAIGKLGDIAPVFFDFVRRAA